MNRLLLLQAFITIVTTLYIVVLFFYAREIITAVEVPPNLDSVGAFTNYLFLLAFLFFLYDAVVKEKNFKWFLILFFTTLLGINLYFYLVYRPRANTHTLDTHP